GAEKLDNHWTNNNGRRRSRRLRLRRVTREGIENEGRGRIWSDNLRLLGRYGRHCRQRNFDTRLLGQTSSRLHEAGDGRGGRVPPRIPGQLSDPEEVFFRDVHGGCRDSCSQLSGL